MRVAKPVLTFACYDYDRVEPLVSGSLPVEGCTLAPVILPASELFPRALLRQEFDITEISAGSYLMQKSRGTGRYTAIPVPVSRAFRHGAIYVRTDRGIGVPADLEGKKVGIPSYQFTAVMWVRGMLQDEYGVDFRKLRYRTGNPNSAGQVSRPALELPPSIDIMPLPPELSLSAALAQGEIDAVISPDTPESCRAGHPEIRRLFPDYASREREYRKRTGFFPTMHLIAIRDELVGKHPWLPANLLRALVAAKTIAIGKLMDMAEDSANRLSLPWLAADIEATEVVTGTTNFWPYGVEENRAEFEAMCRYAHEQHLAARCLRVEELFPASTLGLRDTAYP
jgi:4,5-dihydroxyphthalate decarboxylase